MPEELLVDVDTFETRVALVDDGDLVELHVERSDARSQIGNIYLGTVSRLAPSVQAAFVDIGLQRPGFLPFAQRAEGKAPEAPWHEGQRLPVQVVKDPLNGKGLRLAADLSLAGRHIVLTPFDASISVSRRIEDDAETTRLADLAAAQLKSLALPYGCIVRTAAVGADAQQLRDDLEALHAAWRRIRERCVRAAPADAGSDASAPSENPAASPTLIHDELPMSLRVVRDLVGPDTAAIVVNDGATRERLATYVSRTLAPAPPVRCYEGALGMFDAHGVEAAIRRALQPNVPLPSGGHLLIEHTRAMTTIDVNSGTSTNATNLEATSLATNLQAAQAIPRELRRRNIGGIIVVDFIDMEEAAHQEAVSAALATAARGDPALFRASPLSPLGLVEISRRRVRPSLVQQLGERCGTCEGDRYVATAQTSCYDVLRALRQRIAAFASGENRFLLEAAPPVVERLRGDDARHLAALCGALDCDIELCSRSDFAARRFRLQPLSDAAETTEAPPPQAQAEHMRR